MKIYTEVIWEWDSTKNELVEVSSESFDYEGPLVQAWALAAFTAATTIYGAIKGHQLGQAQAGEMGKTTAENLLSAQLKKQHKEKEYRRHVREVRRRGAYAKAVTRLKGQKLSKRNLVKRSVRGARLTRGTPLNLAVQDIMNTEYMVSMQENETFMNLDNMNHSHHDWNDVHDYNTKVGERRGGERQSLAKQGSDLRTFGRLSQGLSQAGYYYGRANPPSPGGSMHKNKGSYWSDL